MCIFCKIIEGELPSSKVYEDEHIVAILDIAQVTYGHTLVIPKKHCSDILDADEETMIHIAKVLPKLTNQIVCNCKACGSHIISNQGAISGQTVDHLHFHIIPRYSEDDAIIVKFNETEKPELSEVLKTIQG
ncbi:HIT family protein [Anaerorhabdus furcosa]|uniref:Histidine triad (HIT) family protein n=1 Tax=Anaerorhabdus furcosa TaxID=118967 RepID=A0A1T4NAQ0_9FIRM|nr:HIT family protein [Anaerorhabdus furcosa]SJZ76380.1 histidine triad (HIT) family protein [Anaerorhabdus furcosa]